RGSQQRQHRQHRRWRKPATTQCWSEIVPAARQLEPLQPSREPRPHGEPAEPGQGIESNGGEPDGARAEQRVRRPEWQRQSPHVEWLGKPPGQQLVAGPWQQRGPGARVPSAPAQLVAFLRRQSWWWWARRRRTPPVGALVADGVRDRGRGSWQY